MKYILWIAFLVTALLQWAVPAKMIFDREAILATGEEFRFKTVPVDPYDPFRGKFITLRFEANEFPVTYKDNREFGEDIYVYLTTDAEGYAAIHAVSENPPGNHMAYVKAKVESYTSTEDEEKIVVTYPFNRFYMEEWSAFAAEQAYLEALRDSSRVAYAVVRIKEGEAVLKDVVIDGVSVREIVKH